MQQETQRRCWSPQFGRQQYSTPKQVEMEVAGILSQAKCQLVEARYCCGGELSNRFPSPSRLSRIWSDILHLTEPILSAFGWTVGNSSSVLFWHDIWLGECALKDRYASLF
ncbi:hypothetical protein QJS04_geneDACA016147 [Acorus gramineus]|uniref:Uncharacterized protein n=1 Tax=Acorus gramineus TaxID=55184 RepID=A0AAV9ALV5_ACOGR|nr:hypothetical protein QJS04_geneDACA016147 [Acorus gramineus]